MIEFEHALWLWGLAALAVPLLLHLFARRAAPPEDFPPAVLIEKEARSASQARRLRQLLKLLLRLAVLAALVLAFARPRLAGPGAEQAGAEAVALVLVIDDSLSASRPADPAGPEGPTRLERALREARAALAELPPGSEAAIVFASGRSRGPGEPRKLAAGLGEPKSSARARLASALEAAPQFLAAMEPLRPAVLVLSDCEAGALPRDAAKKLPKGTRFSVLDLGAAGLGDDWALLGARLDRPRLVAGESAELLVRVARAPGRGGGAKRRLDLVLGGVAVALREVSLAPGAEAEVAVRFSVESGVHLGELRLAGSDPWKMNDSLPVALSLTAAPRVAVLCSRGDLDGPGRAVRLALSAGPGVERKAFLAETLTREAAALADLSKYDAFFLVGPPEMDASTAGRLAGRVGAGAGAVIFAERPKALAELAVPLGLPVPPAAVKPAEFPSGARLLPTEAGARLFAPFRAAAAEQVFKRALTLKTGGAGVLARMRSGGQDLPGLIERGLGRGTVVVVASGPGRRFSRLAERESAGLFVPLAHELAARAAGIPAAGAAASPSGAVELEASPRERAARFWLADRAGLRAPLGSPASDLRLRFAAPAAAGAYRIDSESEGALLARRALAVRFDPAELSGRRAGIRGAAPAASMSAALAAVTGPFRRGRELSAALAALGLLLLAGEALVSFLAAERGRGPDAELPARRKRGRAGA